MHCGAAADAMRREFGRCGPRIGDRGRNVMCMRTRTASEISNQCPELLAARAGPLGRDGRVAAAQFRGPAGLAGARMCRGVQECGAARCRRGLYYVGKPLRAPARLRTRLILAAEFVGNECGVLCVDPGAKCRIPRCRPRGRNVMCIRARHRKFQTRDQNC